MFSDVDLLQRLWLFHLRLGILKLSPFVGVNTSFALSLRAWSSEASISSKSAMSDVSFPNSPLHTIHYRAMYLARLLDQTDVVSICLSKSWGDIRPLLQKVSLVRWKAFRAAFHMVFSQQKEDPEYFAGRSNTPWNPPTIHWPDLTATAPQMSLLSLNALLFLQSHLFSELCGVDVQWFQDNS